MMKSIRKKVKKKKWTWADRLAETKAAGKIMTKEETDALWRLVRD